MNSIEDPDRIAPHPRGDTEEPDPAIRVVVLRGELDVATVPAFRDALNTLADNETVECICVDLVEVTFIDSTGLIRSSTRCAGSFGARTRLVIA